MLVVGTYIFFSCKTSEYRREINQIFDRLEAELLRSREGLILCEEYNLMHQMDTIRTIRKIERDSLRVLIHCTDNSKYLLRTEGEALPEEIRSGAKLRHIRRYYPMYSAKDSTYVPFKTEYIAYQDSLQMWQRIE